MIRFYNPRKDKWAKHFRLNQSLIESLTEIGEVAIKILGFNSFERIQERVGLIELKLFPSAQAKKLSGKIRD